jgi:hypothetical protein
MKEVQESYSEQDSGGRSRSESLHKEKVLKAREIAGQRAGHFVGKIANGVPPYFNVQFEISKYVEQDIPPFSTPVNTGDASLDREIMEEIVQKNYTRILNQVHEILKEYQNEDV